MVLCHDRRYGHRPDIFVDDCDGRIGIHAGSELALRVWQVDLCTQDAPFRVEGKGGPPDGSLEFRSFDCLDTNDGFDAIPDEDSVILGHIDIDADGVYTGHHEDRFSLVTTST